MAFLNKFFLFLSCQKQEGMLLNLEAFLLRKVHIERRWRFYERPIFSVSIMSCPKYMSLGFAAILTTICCISGILAAVENTVCLLLVRKIHSLRKTARYFMASLAAAELFSGVTANTFYASWLLLNSERLETKVFWKTESAVWLSTTTVTTFNLVNVALDRYIAITSPLQYHSKMNLTRCKTLITFSWSLAILSVLLVYAVPEEDLPKIWISGTAAAMLFPLCIITFCYFSIYRATKRTFPEGEHITDAQQITENKRQKKTAWTFGIVTVLCTVLFAPSFIFNCAVFFKSYMNTKDLDVDFCVDTLREVWICIAVVSYFSAFCDPWVYLIRMPDFRIALKELPSCPIWRTRNQLQLQRNGENREDLQGANGVYNTETFNTAL